MAPPLGRAADEWRIVDFDRSGTPDLIGQDATGLFWLRDPAANGTPAPIALAPIGHNRLLDAFEVADLDGDGDLDLLIAQSSMFGFDVVLLDGVGNGSVAAPRVIAQYGLFFTNHVRVGDFNGDGLADLVIQGGEARALAPRAEVWMQGPRGVFAPTLMLPEQPVLLGVGDFTGDGVDDLLTGPNGLFRFRSGGPGGLGAAVAFTSPVQRFEFVAIADLDGDRIDDAVWSAAQQPEAWVQWGAATTFPAPLQQLPQLTSNVAGRVHVADLDGDRVLDLGITDIAGQNLLAWRGRGNRSFSPATQLQTGVADGLLADLDGDGDADFAMKDGRRALNLATYGSACGAPIDLQASTVVPGTALTLSSSGAPPATLAAVFFAAADRPTPCGTRVDLGTAFGASPLLLTDASGRASLTFSMPAGSLPVPVFLQTIVLDPNGGYAAGTVRLSSSQGRCLAAF